jgi:NADH-quinone oxidoreductase subunit E
VSLRRLHHEQPASFAFSDTNKAHMEKEIAKYPAGRQASAVIAALWIGQEQEGWEVATFYTMFNLEPVGKHLVQVCTTTPCWLRGSDEVVAACKKHIHEKPHTTSADGKFTWMEAECLGACVNAPMMQIGNDTYEDLDGPTTEKILQTLRDGKTPKPGPQTGRHSSEPEGGATVLKEVQS